MAERKRHYKDEKRVVEDIIRTRDVELSRQGNFRDLWQDTANWILPLHNRIQSSRTPGERLGVYISDVTAVFESRNMASGLAAQIAPADQEFFRLEAISGDRDSGRAQEYSGQLTEDSHALISNSNFYDEFELALLSLVVFGNAASYPVWDDMYGLLFRNYPIGSYQTMISANGVVDTIIVTPPQMTARQMFQRFGRNCGQSIKKALEEGKENDPIFSTVQIVRPRRDRNRLSRLSIDMPFASIIVCETDSVILYEGGFNNFPVACPRGWRSPGEDYGRGQGTEILPQVTKLNQMDSDVSDAGNLWARPPLEILDTYEGIVNMEPSANHFVTEIGSIRAIDLGARGSFPYGVEAVEQQRDIVREAFYKNILEQMSSLKGDRRTTVEIQARLREGFKKISQPIGRVFTELLGPILRRSLNLAFKNGALERPPGNISSLKIRYTGPLALALQDQHVTAMDIWLDMLERMEAMAPGTSDNANLDEASRDTGRFLGVKETHLRTIADRDRRREERRKLEAQKMELEAAAVAAQAYGQTTKAPEEGSMAESA